MRKHLDYWALGFIALCFSVGLGWSQVQRGIQMSQDSSGFLAADIVLRHFHIPLGGTAPALSACGAGTIAGNDTVGSITAAQATCTATFATAWPAAPRCLISGGPTTGGLVAASTTAMTITGLTAASVYSYFCIGQ